jgi:hypothetical protein
MLTEDKSYSVGRVGEQEVNFNPYQPCSFFPSPMYTRGELISHGFIKKTASLGLKKYIYSKYSLLSSTHL